MSDWRTNGQKKIINRMKERQEFTSHAKAISWWQVGSRKKDTTPSKSFPHHFSSCLNLVLYFPLDWLSPIREEYVANITPFLTLPFSFDDIFAYLNYNGEKKWFSQTIIKEMKLAKICHSYLYISGGMIFTWQN